MSNTKGSNTSDVVAYSKAYFILGGKLQELKAQGQKGNFSAFVQQVESAYNTGSISDKEREQLLNVANNSAANHSEEYIRLCGIISEASLSSTLGKDSAEIKEEILLADKHNLLIDRELDELLGMINGNIPSPTMQSTLAVVTPTGPLANRVPMRRKAAARQKTHTEGFYELEQEYRKLFTAKSMENSDANTRKFFRRVAQYYQDGRITPKEYQSFHSALDDRSAYLDQITIDITSKEFARFKDSLLDFMSTDGEVVEVIKQVASWAVNNGTPQAAVVNNIIGVASTNLPVFLNSGNMLVTVSNRERKIIPIREMQLS